MNKKNKTLVGSILSLVVIVLLYFAKSAIYDALMGKDAGGQEVILATEEPAQAAKEIAMPKPEKTAKPTATPKPEQTAKPTATPKPEKTAKPTATPKPEQTAKPTATPKPEKTQAPTETALHFRNQKLLDQHYEKHGIEMGFDSAEEYEAAAAAVVSNPDVLHKTEKEDGDDVYYVEATNEFVIVSKDGYIRTYFLPSGGIKYYNKQ